MHNNIDILLQQLANATDELVKAKLLDVNNTRKHDILTRQMYSLFDSYIKSLGVEVSNQINQFKSSLAVIIINHITTTQIELLLNEKITSINIEILPDNNYIVKIACSKLGKK